MIINASLATILDNEWEVIPNKETGWYEVFNKDGVRVGMASREVVGILNIYHEAKALTKEGFDAVEPIKYNAREVWS